MSVLLSIRHWVKTAARKWRRLFAFSDGMLPDLKNNRREAEDHLAVLDVAFRLARAIDNRDVREYARCLDKMIRDGSVSYDALEYAGGAMQRASDFEWTHHKLFNPAVRLQGRRAYALIDVEVDAVAKQSRDSCTRIIARYELELERRKSGWVVVKRTMTKRRRIEFALLI